jgi:hypothetical protein
VYIQLDEGSEQGMAAEEEDLEEEEEELTAELRLVPAEEAAGKEQHASIIIIISSSSSSSKSSIWLSGCCGWCLLMRQQVRIATSLEVQRRHRVAAMSAACDPASNQQGFYRGCLYDAALFAADGGQQVFVCTAGWVQGRTEAAAAAPDAAYTA